MIIRFTKKKLVWLIAVTIVLVTAITLVFVVANNNSDNEQSIVNNSTEQSGVETVATINETFKSAQELQEYLKKNSNDPNPFTALGNIDQDSVDWKTNEVATVEFYASAGQSVKESTVSERGEVIVVMNKAPEGCAYPAVQYKHIQFLPVLIGQQLKQNAVYIQYVENSASCDQYQ